MTLQEAVKSGKPFRHRRYFAENFWIDSENDDLSIQTTCIDMAISDDWEIQEKTSYSKADVERAINEAMSWADGFIDKATPREVLDEAMKAADMEEN